ncbi:hypothetical protein CHELA1G11_11462 [Hyphomicrobiales bacterium]|nr:hypothetical protein CHELA1G11_11462 [Hyphomicrobiales bacterium]CAH1667596.1 hypothetical protein CHELA1G2_12847 [Hyphomicrobiales bacterium]
MRSGLRRALVVMASRVLLRRPAHACRVGEASDEMPGLFRVASSSCGGAWLWGLDTMILPIHWNRVLMGRRLEGRGTAGASSARDCVRKVRE